MFKKFSLILIYFFIFSISGCDKGIEPAKVSEPMGFSGKVSFIGIWPEGIKRTHLVVFKNSIKDTSDFFPPNLSFVVDSIPYRSNSFNYNSITDNYLPILQFSPGTYNYVAVAQSKTPFISLRRRDWTIVGVFCVNGDQSKPAALTISAGKFINDVNITVDFNNPPPQPPQ